MSPQTNSLLSQRQEMAHRLARNLRDPTVRSQVRRSGSVPLAPIPVPSVAPTQQVPKHFTASSATSSIESRCFRDEDPEDVQGLPSPSQSCGHPSGVQRFQNSTCLRSISFGEVSNQNNAVDARHTPTVRPLECRGLHKQSMLFTNANEELVPCGRSHPVPASSMPFTAWCEPQPVSRKGCAVARASPTVWELVKSNEHQQEGLKKEAFEVNNCSAAQALRDCLSMSARHVPHSSGQDFACQDDVTGFRTELQVVQPQPMPVARMPPFRHVQTDARIARTQQPTVRTAACEKLLETTKDIDRRLEGIFARHENLQSRFEFS